jgi:hypothetical protein
MVVLTALKFVGYASCLLAVLSLAVRSALQALRKPGLYALS